MVSRAVIVIEGARGFLRFDLLVGMAIRQKNAKYTLLKHTLKSMDVDDTLQNKKAADLAFSTHPTPPPSDGGVFLSAGLASFAEFDPSCRLQSALCFQDWNARSAQSE
jgi:hypothetical protein